MLRNLIFIMFFFVSFYADANIIGADTQNFNPNYSHYDFVTVRSSKTLEKYHLNFSLFGDYSAGTLPAYPLDVTPDIVREVSLEDSAIYAHFGFGFGLTDYLDIGLSLPRLLKQTVDNPNPRGQFARKGPVEVRGAVKARLANFEKGGGVAAQFSVGFNRIVNNPFIGDDPGATLNFELIADKKIGKMHVAGNLGYRLRSPGESVESIGDPAVGSVVTELEPNDDIFIASAALGYDLTEKWTVMGELWAAFPDGDFGGLAVYRDVESYEALVGAKYKWSDKLNFHGGATTGINNGISVPDYRLYAGLNYMVGPLWKSRSRTKTRKAVKINDDLSYYDPGFRQGFMAGYGIGPYAGLGAKHGETLEGGVEYPEGYYDGYIASGTSFPDEVKSNTPYSKCYRTGFQGKIGNGPATGQGLGYGDVLGLGVDCSEGFDEGWNDAPDSGLGKTSYYPQGYREGYKAGFGIGPHKGLGADHGKNLDGGYEFDSGFYDGYNDASGAFPGGSATRVYGKGYRNGFQGKLGKGPGKGTGPSFGATIESADPYPKAWEHGWFDAPGGDSKDPVVLDATDGNAFDGLEAKSQESFRLENVNFDSGSYKIRKSSFPVLGSLARHLKKGGGFKSLFIEGHTDNVGKAAYNKKLSIQRAMSVRAFLSQVHGIDKKKISADGMGEGAPIASNKNETGREKNRRVEFTIIR